MLDAQLTAVADAARALVASEATRADETIPSVDWIATNRAAMDALTAAVDALNVPEGAATDETFRITRRWFESYTVDGKLWCGSSSPMEVIQRSRGRGCTYRMVVTVETHRAEPWTPDEDAPEATDAG